MDYTIAPLHHQQTLHCCPTASPAAAHPIFHQRRHARQGVAQQPRRMLLLRLQQPPHAAEVRMRGLLRHRRLHLQKEAAALVAYLRGRWGVGRLAAMMA